MTFYDNNSKYMSLLAIVCVCLPYLQMILLITKVDMSVQIYIWIVTIGIMAFAFAYLPLREYLQHQVPVMGKVGTVGAVVYLNYTSRNKVLIFEKEIEEIKIDWTNQGLKVLENSRLYLRGKREILKTESKLEKENRQQIKTPEELNKLIKGLNIDVTASPLEQLSQVLYGVYGKDMDKLPIPIKKEKKLILKKKGKGKKSIQELETPINDDIEDYRQNIALYHPEPEEIVIKNKQKEPMIIKPEFINLSDLGILEEDQIKFLKSMFFYKANLYHPESLDGYDYLKFDQAFLILPSIFSEALATSEMSVYDYADYLVKVQGCDVMWVCYGFVRGKIPLLHCFASENIVKLQTPEMVKASLMKHSTLYYLRIKIMEWLINKLSAEQDPFQQDINRLETQNEGLRDKYDYLTEEYLSDSFIKAPIDIQKENQKLRERLAGEKKWKTLAIVGFTISIVLIIVVFFVFAPMFANVNIAPSVP